MPSEMLKGVARALAARTLMQVLRSGVVAKEGEPAELAVAASEAVDDLWPDYVEDARAAIEAMREPPAALIDAAYKAVNGWAAPGDQMDGVEFYRAMIDAALTEEADPA